MTKYKEQQKKIKMKIPTRNNKMTTNNNRIVEKGNLKHQGW
jgi:hypothetical protein